MKVSRQDPHLLTIENFYKNAKNLRREFDQRFKPSTEVQNRFVWDYWHTPEYTHLRTPAYLFFDPKEYAAFHNHLVWWGRENLGCHDVTPTWLSCYVDGCKQSYHADVPHGPWAFVFSLTNWQQRQFTGGETQMLRSEVLNYWNDFNLGNGVEENKIIEKVAPEFNRLIVFDPRIPHGVSEVKGTHDVTEGRLVLHGWFVNPRPFIQGPVKTQELEKLIGQVSMLLEDLFNQGLSAQGVLSLRLKVQATGRVSQIKVLTNSLKATHGNTSAELEQLLQLLAETLKNFQFKKQRAPSEITLPLIFENSSN